MKPSDQLRKVIEAAIKSGLETRYSIAKRAGVNYTVLANWLDRGTDVRSSTIDQLSESMGMDLTKSAKGPKLPMGRSPMGRPPQARQAAVKTRKPARPKGAAKRRRRK